MGHKKTALTVQRIDPEAAFLFVRAYHYSKVLPRLNRHYLGIYEDGELSGVVLLSHGTQPLQTIRKVFPAHDLTTASYLEIGKMCFSPEKNHTGYFGSLALSALIKWTRANTGCLFLYTLADGNMGKCGYVYQAANFRYLGHFKTSVPKKNWLTHEFCTAKGIEKIDGRMFRYICPLTKEAEEILNSYPQYQNIPYPKDQDLYFAVRTGHGEYKQIPPPRFDREICNYNPQNYGH